MNKQTICSLVILPAELFKLRKARLVLYKKTHQRPTAIIKF